jgi:hypothetical protein
VLGADGVFKEEGLVGFGLVVEPIKLRFGMEPGLGFGGVGFDSSVCCSIVSTGSSMMNKEDKRIG